VTINLGLNKSGDFSFKSLYTNLDENKNIKFKHLWKARIPPNIKI
jgi:hypothetical protein